MQHFTEISTVYPSARFLADHQAQLQKIADEKNGGEIGQLVRLVTYDSGAEDWAAPALGVKWREDLT